MLVADEKGGGWTVDGSDGEVSDGCWMKSEERKMQKHSVEVAWWE